MNMTWIIIRAIIFYTLSLLIIGAVIVYSVRKAEDPARMLFRWVVTALIVGFMIWKVAPMVGKGDTNAAFVGVPLTAVCGLALAITWRQAIAAIVAKPFTSLYDGGDVAPDPRPAYSVAQARQKQGHYLEAIAEARKQLDRFPTDVEGQLLVAQIQAEDLQDLQSAEMTIEHLCAQPDHAPANIAFGLYSMADWYLSVGKDAESAKRMLEKIIQSLPDSEFALGAAQRIAHLSSPEMLLEQGKRFVVTEGPKDLGLQRARAESKATPESDATIQASEYVKHLEAHPLDTEAREKLAVLYADHYGRLDMATIELEQMINYPNQPARLVDHWLNVLADVQIRCGADYETVKGTLERIVDRGPNLAAAEKARSRIALLKLEMKPKTKSEGIKMGSYEQNIGLKRGRGG